MSSCMPCPPPLPPPPPQVPTPPPPPPLPGHAGNTHPPPIPAPSSAEGSVPPPPPLPGVPIPPPPPGVPPPLPIPGVPPPPPPFGFGGSGMGIGNGIGMKQCRKPSIRPAVALKPLFWKRIQLHRIDLPVGGSTLWEQLQEASIQVEEFNELFTKVQRKKEGHLETSKSTNRIKHQVVHLLDRARSQSVGILLSSLHVEVEEIRQCLYDVDTTILDHQTLKALYEIRPTEEELQIINSHVRQNPDALLDRPEQFLLDVSQISCYEERLFCMVSKTTVMDSLTEIGQSLTNFRLVCEILETSDGVSSILGLVLAFGNYMNGGNNTRGQADGFELEILPKLKDVKSKDNTTNLLEYLVKAYVKLYDENAGTISAVFPLPEPTDIQLASQVTFDDVQADLARLEKRISDCDRKIQSISQQKDEKTRQPFQMTMSQVLDGSRQELQQQLQALQECKKRYETLWKFFNPQISPICPQEFFELWATFSGDFKVYWKKEQQLIAKQIYERTRRKLWKEKQEKIPKKRVSLNGLKLKMASTRKGN